LICKNRWRTDGLISFRRKKRGIFSGFQTREGEIAKRLTILDKRAKIFEMLQALNPLKSRKGRCDQKKGRGGKTTPEKVKKELKGKTRGRGYRGPQEMTGPGLMRMDYVLGGIPGVIQGDKK